MGPKKATKTVEVTKTVETSSKNANKTIEEMYQSKTQEEHILARPDTYVGDIQPQVENMYVYDDSTNRIVTKKDSNPI